MARTSAASSSGRNAIWVDPSSTLFFHYFGGHVPTINREWIEALMLSANSASGLVCVPEPVSDIPTANRLRDASYAHKKLLHYYDLVKKEVISMTALILACSARAASGLSQSELALRSGIAGSSLSLIEHGKREPTVATLEALVRSTGHTLVTIPTLRADAAGIAAQISAVLLYDQSEIATPATNIKKTARAFRRFIQLADNLAAEVGATRVGLALTEPAPITCGHDSAQWDAAIAALCEYRLNADSLPVPQWITNRAGNPGNPWKPETTVYDIPADLTQVPAEFLSRGILIEAATLVSV
ncbi:helix-turn-helix domain-containing protein [Cryobacterium luteum]|uniref:Helix-turn-helix domain-containing protein n=1 Tax=Cryobacterium luteum TaxID=1424661 RepID=A0A1H8L0D6_9MICO|nr:helix-turn-helix transcriptional regulator [Cryobacterium luteum]TFB82338.1 helix-turn-helix domain-containing protein [Cryobacterium luteum]SEN98613.1 Transcriptional regulator, contains XRE-family HTH domain [Cryobacterium luteum]